MKQTNKTHRRIFQFYLLAVFCAFVLLTFFHFTQKSEVFRKRTAQGYRITEEVRYQETEDEKAPAGIKKEYILEPGQIDESENCLAFYVVHHYVQVYVEDELVYSLMPQKEDSITRTTGCVWVIVPLSEEDSGKEIRVILTPVYDSVLGRQTEFLIGARHSILMSTVKKDIFDIILSVLAIGVGIVFVVISLFWLCQKKSENSLLYLGIFSAFLGLWKLTDTRTIAMMFPENAFVLSQLSLVMMSLAVVPFVLFIEKQIEKKRWKFLNLVCAISITASMLQILLQAAGKVDFRESLMITHGVIALTSVAVVFTAASQLHAKKSNRKLMISCVCFLLFVAGTLVDLLKYYITGTSGGILSTIAIFLFYIVVMGVMSILDLTHQATIDFATGLFNRSCCREKLTSDPVIHKECCMIMFDLNGLKRVNDTLGHEAGNEIIEHFADILRQNVPASAFLGRYGGDEFIAIIEKCDRNMADKILADISEKVKEYNVSGSGTEISYAAGYALSVDYPYCTMAELMEKADEMMYENKNSFYQRMSS